NQSQIANKRKAQFIIFAAFVLGIVVGASAQYLLFHRSLNNQAGATVKIIDELTQRLNLTADQRIRVDQFLADSRRQYQNLDDEFRPQYKAIRMETRKRISVLLTPEQKILFDQYTSELDARREVKEREAREKAFATPTPGK
ncbi:MAG: hypothetical protein ACRD82_23735, partial [Blastocatellia bacterium]